VPASSPSVRPSGGAGVSPGPPVTRHPVALDPASPLTDRATAEAYVASVCFKHGPPRLVGTELEWLVRDARDPAHPLDPAVLARALGPHRPTTLPSSSVVETNGDTPHQSSGPAPLPAGGTVTAEPGG
jgi:glutamate--cysteine ligase